MIVDWQAVQAIATVVSITLAIGAWFYARAMSHSHARRAEIAELKKEMGEERQRRRTDTDDLKTRLTRTESTLDQVPTGTGMHELALSIQKLAGQVGVITERVDGMNRIVERLEKVTSRQEQFLLEGSKH